MTWGRGDAPRPRIALHPVAKQYPKQHLIRRQTVKRRNILVAITSLVVVAISSRSQSSGPLVTVFKTPTCGCFTVKVQEVNDTSAYERQYRVPRSMVSCHTAVVNGYTIEGHVPAEEIKRLLSERPRVVGLAVPGMPVGSPGMDAAHSDAYSVFVFDESGHSSIYAPYPAR